MAESDLRDAVRRLIDAIDDCVIGGDPAKTDALDAIMDEVEGLLAEPEPLPCGHQPSDVASSDEGTSYCRACEAEARKPEPPASLSFHALRSANSERMNEIPSWKAEWVWSATDWSACMAEEVGELARLSIRRRQGKEVPDSDFAKEMADVAIYLDAFAYRLGIDLGRAVVDKFNADGSRFGSAVRIDDGVAAVNGPLPTTPPEPPAPKSVVDSFFAHPECLGIFPDRASKGIQWIARFWLVDPLFDHEACGVNPEAACAAALAEIEKQERAKEIGHA